MKRTLLFMLMLITFALTACGKKSASGKDASLTGVTEKVALEDYWELPLSESENGYYYNRGTESSPLGIHYVDKSTGKDILLCNKPECRHDGNEFCVATNKKYNPFSMQYYDNALYVGAICLGENTFEIKLIKVSPDGSSLSEVATIFQSNLASSSDPTMHSEQNKMILHRGKAIFHVRIDGEAQMEDTVAFGTAIYDLNDGSVKYLDAEPISTENPQLENLQARGDDFYYVTLEGRKHVLHKYHLADGSNESIELLPNFNGQYAVMNNGNVYYLRALKKKVYLKRADGTNQELDVSFTMHDCIYLDPLSVPEGLPTDLIPLNTELAYDFGIDSIASDGERLYVGFFSIMNFYELISFSLPENLEYLTEQTDENGRSVIWYNPLTGEAQASVCYYALSNYLRYSVFDADGVEQRELEVPIPIKDAAGELIAPADMVPSKDYENGRYVCYSGTYFTADKIFVRASVYEKTDTSYSTPMITYAEESIEDFLAGKPFPESFYLPH